MYINLTGDQYIDRWDGRGSSTIRFRKSMAATFNLRQWKFWSRNPDDKAAQEYAHHQIMVERQEKARKTYKKYKETGQFPDYNAKILIGHTKTSKYLSNAADSIDSGVELWEKDLYSIYPDNKPSGDTTLKRRSKSKFKYILNIEDNPPDIQTPSLRPSASVADLDSSPRIRPNSFIKSHSLVNLGKVFNGARGGQSNGLSPSKECTTNTLKTPSRRDIQKQQKICKRVSDLEIKLEDARKQLSKLKAGHDDYQEHHSYNPPSLKQKESIDSLTLFKDQTQLCPPCHRNHSRSSSYAAPGRKLLFASTAENSRKRSLSMPNNNNDLFPTVTPDYALNCDVPKDGKFSEIAGNDFYPETTVVSYFSDSDDDRCKKSSRDFFHKISHAKKTKEYLSSGLGKKIFSADESYNHPFPSRAQASRSLHVRVMSN